MKKLDDYFQTFPTNHPDYRGRARIRIYEPEDPTQPHIVVCTQDPSNAASVEMLAERIIQAVQDAGNLPDEYRWFAHYEAGTQYIPMLHEIVFVVASHGYCAENFIDRGVGDLERMVGDILG